MCESGQNLEKQFKFELNMILYQKVLSFIDFIILYRLETLMASYRNYSTLKSLSKLCPDSPMHSYSPRLTVANEHMEFKKCSFVVSGMLLTQTN